MTNTPVRRHHGGTMQDRPLGWARNPLTEFDQLLTEMSGLIDVVRAASRSPMVAGPAESVMAGGSFLVDTDPRGTSPSRLRFRLGVGGQRRFTPPRPPGAGFVNQK